MRKLSFGVILIGLTALSINSSANSKNIIDSLQKKVADPVCKIKPNSAKTAVYNKVTYYLCSESCKQKFLAVPAKYINK